MNVAKRDINVGQHAIERIHERFNEDYEYFKKSLEEFTAVRMSLSYGNKCGFLVYDYRHDLFCLLIVDERTRTLVTALTLEQAFNSTWLDQLTMAKFSQAIERINQYRNYKDQIPIPPIISRHFPIQDLEQYPVSVIVNFINEKSLPQVMTYKTKFLTSLFETLPSGYVEVKWTTELLHSIWEEIKQILFKKNFMVKSINRLYVDLKAYGTSECSIIDQIHSLNIQDDIYSISTHELISKQNTPQT